jgi:hypothetical protein
MDGAKPSETPWVAETRKRLREDDIKRKAEHLEAVRKRREEEEADKLLTLMQARGQYRFYSDDLLRIQDEVERCVSWLRLDEFCWIFFSKVGIHVCLTDKMPPSSVFPAERPVGYPFRTTDLIRWGGALPIKEGLPFGSAHLLDAFVFDITHWAINAGLAVSPSGWVSKVEVHNLVPATEYVREHILREWGAGVRVPFSKHDEEMLVSGCIPELEVGDLCLAIRVPYEETPRQ